MSDTSFDQNGLYDTDLIWGLAALKKPKRDIPIADVTRLVRDMYPGIQYCWSQALFVIESGFMKDDLNQQIADKSLHKMSDFKTEEEAMTALGSVVKIDPVKPFDWAHSEDWDQWCMNRLAAKQNLMP